MLADPEIPVPNFAAGGIATPADAALCMQLGAERCLWVQVFLSPKILRLCESDRTRDDALPRCGGFVGSKQRIGRAYARN